MGCQQRRSGRCGRSGRRTTTRPTPQPARFVAPRTRLGTVQIAKLRRTRQVPPRHQDGRQVLPTLLPAAQLGSRSGLRRRHHSRSRGRNSRREGGGGGRALRLRSHIRLDHRRYTATLQTVPPRRLRTRARRADLDRDPSAPTTTTAASSSSSSLMPELLIRRRARTSTTGRRRRRRSRPLLRRARAARRAVLMPSPGPGMSGSGRARAVRTFPLQRPMTGPERSRAVARHTLTRRQTAFFRRRRRLANATPTPAGRSRSRDRRTAPALQRRRRARAQSTMRRPAPTPTAARIVKSSRKCSGICRLCRIRQTIKRARAVGGRATRARAAALDPARRGRDGVPRLVKVERAQRRGGRTARQTRTT